ncbi:hypothetical protein Tco_0733265 [Tanacetum coccineum]
MESQSTSTTAGAGSSSAPLRIVSFDLEKETYGENFPPVYDEGREGGFREVFTLGNRSLALRGPLLYRGVLDLLPYQDL